MVVHHVAISGYPPASPVTEVLAGSTVLCYCVIFCCVTIEAVRRRPSLGTHGS